MPSPHDPSRHAAGAEARSAVGTVVVAVVAYELAAGAVNQFLDGDVVPSLMPRIEAMTPRSVARAVTPQWTRYAGWIAVGAVYTLGVRALRSALPAPLRR